MKKNWKHLAAGGAAAAVLTGILAVPTLAATGSQMARLDYQNMKVELDGQTLNLRDSQGNAVEPFTINGTTYLPLAAIGQALGLNVAWDGATNTVILTSGGTASSGTGTQGETTDIGVERAKSIALNHAGLSASDVTFVRSVLEYDNGRAEYEVEFWKDNVEYDYEIDASTGNILSADRDIEGYTIPQQSQSSNDIGVEQAKTIALNHAGVSASNASFVFAQLDYENGRRVYEVEFYSGSTEYDYEIDAADGSVLSYDYDAERYTPQQSQTSNDIGVEQAKTVALNHAGVAASDAVFVHAKLDYDDGRRVYEVEFYSGSTEYDYEIDAASGDVLSYDYDAERYTLQQPQTGSLLSEARVKEIVEARAGTTGTYREFKLERDDGRTVYEGELRSGWTEYEFTVDAYSGDILEWSVDR